jgi:anti-sigma factor RsiW
MTGVGGHFDEELQDFLDGRLIPTKADEIMSHLNSCFRCRFQFDALQKAKQAAAEAIEIPVSPDLRDKIVESLNSEDARQKKRNN